MNKEEVLNSFINRLNRTNKVCKGDVLRLEGDIGANLITREIPLDSFTTIPTNMNIDLLKKHMVNCRLMNRSGSRNLADEIISDNIYAFARMLKEDYHINTYPRSTEYIGYTDVVKVFHGDKAGSEETTSFISFSSLTFDQYLGVRDSLLAMLNPDGLAYDAKDGSRTYTNLTQLGLEAFLIYTASMARLLAYNCCDFKTFREYHPGITAMTENYAELLPAWIKDKNKFASVLAGVTPTDDPTFWGFDILADIRPVPYKDDTGEIFAFARDTSYQNGTTLSHARYIRNDITVDDIMDALQFYSLVILKLYDIGYKMRFDTNYHAEPFSLFLDDTTFSATMQMAYRFGKDFIKSMEAFKHKRANENNCNCNY